MNGRYKAGRTAKTLLNAKINTTFQVLAMIVAFFSRKVFLSSFGNSFIGLSVTIQNLIGALNLVELGIGAATVYVLYSPLQQNNRVEITAILSATKHLYRIIAWVMLIIGLLAGCFIGRWFDAESTGISVYVTLALFYVYLSVTLTDYVFNYRQLLLQADQKSYVIFSSMQICQIIKSCVQMSIVYYTANYWIWLLVEILFCVLYCTIINIRIKRTYPWLGEIKISKEEAVVWKDIIRRKSFQLAIHKVGEYLHFQTLPLIIYAIVGLEIVSLYSNYTMISTKVSVIFGTVLTGLGAGIGNLIAENDDNRISCVWGEIMIFRTLLGGYCALMFVMFMSPFIGIWLGEEYQLPFYAPLILAIQSYIGLQRRGIEQFLNGYGLFSDVWAPIAEGILDICSALLSGYFWGFKGILWGTLISNVLIVLIWKPYYLFSVGFKRPVSDYWIPALRHTLVCGIICALIYFASERIFEIEDCGLGTLVLAACCVTIVYFSVTLIVMTKVSDSTKRLIKRFLPSKISDMKFLS